jgi:hypothetical protein
VLPHVDTDFEGIAAGADAAARTAIGLSSVKTILRVAGAHKYAVRR